MSFLHYLNGAWVRGDNLKISVFDLSVLRGFGVFEFLRTYGKTPFMLEEHLDRLFKSADLVGIKVVKKKGEIRKIILEGLEKNAFRTEGDLSVRIILTGGEGPDSVTPGKPSVIAIYSKTKVYPKKYYQKGVKIITLKTTRFLAEAKSLNYLMAVVGLQRAKRTEAVEALYTDERGVIYEATTSNFFVVVKGKIKTPKEGILQGITRKVLFDLTKKEGIEIEEGKVLESEIGEFDEAFLTATEKEIMPVVKIDDKKIGSGQVGGLTKKLMRAFRNRTRSIKKTAGKIRER